MKKIVLTVCLASMTCFEFQAINIKLLKGTHDIVAADYSPVMGLSFLEWGIAEQWYKLSARNQAVQLKEILEKNPTALSQHAQLAQVVANMPKNNATQNLIMSMFHIAGGTFNTTNADNNPVKYIGPREIGKILHVLEKWSQVFTNSIKMDELKQQVVLKKSNHEAKRISIEKEIQTLNSQLSKTKSAAKSAQGADTQTAKNSVHRLQLELTKKSEELRKHLVESKKIVDPAAADFSSTGLQQELYGVCTGFGFKNQQNQQSFQEKDWKPFVSSLVGSVQEAIGDQQSYAQNTAEGILLGYLLKKSNTRQDLQDYFRGFLNTDDFVLPSDQAYSDEQIKEILGAKTDATDFKKTADLLAVYSYKELWASSFPKIVSNKTVNYKGIIFPDCVENTIRMLANIVTYHLPTGKVGVVPDQLSINPTFKKFYESEDGLCAQASEVGNAKVHQAWAQVIENMPGCSYNRICNNQENKEVRNFCDGAIPVDAAPAGLPTHEIEIAGKTYQLPIKTIKDRTYWLVPKDSGLICTEMMPNASNIVVSMNHIFDLKLLDNQMAIFDSNFASNYFEKMCKKLGWVPQVNLANLNDQKLINIPIRTDVGIFKIHLHDKAHGYVSTQDAAKLDVNLEVPKTTIQSVVAAILGAGLKKIADCPENLQTASLYKDLNVLNIDQRLDVVKQMATAKNSFSAIEKNYMQSLIMSFSFVDDSHYLERIVENYGYALKSSGLDDFIVASLQLYDVAHQSRLINKLLVPLIQHKLMTFGQAVPFLEKGINDSDNQVRSATVSCIEQLIKNKLMTFGQAVPFLEKGIIDSDNQVRSYTALSIEQLIKNKLMTFGQAVPFLEKGIIDSNKKVRSFTALSIEQFITNKLITFEQAVPFLEKGIIDRYDEVRSRTVSCIKQLTKDKLITFEQAVPFLEKGVIDSSQYVRSRAVSCIEQLINDKVMIFEQIVPFLKTSMNDANRDAKTAIVYSIRDLMLNKLITLEQALPFFKKGIDNVRHATLSCIEVLAEKKLMTFEQALPFVEKGINDIPYDVVSNYTLNLIKRLIEKKLITVNQIEQLIEVCENNNISELYKLSRKAQAAEPEATSQGMLSRSLGSLRSTPGARMRYEPFKYNFAAAEIAPKNQSDAIQENVDSIDPIAKRSLFDPQAQQDYFEQQRQQVLKRQEQLAQRRFDSVEQPKEVASGIGAAGKISLERQRRLMQQNAVRRLRLPTSTELGRGAVRSARAAI